MPEDIYQEYCQIVKLFKKYIEEVAPLTEIVSIEDIAPISRPCALERKTKEINGHSSLSLEQVRNEIANCKRCQLCSQRRNIVLGTGNEQADLVIIGEAPGAEEDIQGEPFVGPAGQLLTKMLQAININRKDVYITNVVKCRPPSNRNPLPEEIKACNPYLILQLKIIKPKIIFTLGNFATKTMLGSTSGITELRGKFYDYRGINTENCIKLLPTFHPSALLRDTSLKRLAWEDLQRLKEEMK